MELELWMIFLLSTLFTIFAQIWPIITYQDTTVNLYLLHGIFVRCDQLLLHSNNLLQACLQAQLRQFLTFLTLELLTTFWCLSSKKTYLQWSYCILFDCRAVSFRNRIEEVRYCNLYTIVIVTVYYLTTLPKIGGKPIIVNASWYS